MEETIGPCIAYSIDQVNDHKFGIADKSISSK